MKQSPIDILIKTLTNIAISGATGIILKLKKELMANKTSCFIGVIRFAPLVRLYLRAAQNDKGLYC